MFSLSLCISEYAVLVRYRYPSFAVSLYPPPFSNPTNPLVFLYFSLSAADLSLANGLFAISLSRFPTTRSHSLPLRFVCLTHSTFVIISLHSTFIFLPVGMLIWPVLLSLASLFTNLRFVVVFGFIPFLSHPWHITGNKTRKSKSLSSFPATET